MGNRHGNRLPCSLTSTSVRKIAVETVNIYEAKTRLSQLVDKAASGEDVVVSRNGKPLVRITAWTCRSARSGSGCSRER